MIASAAHDASSLIPSLAVSQTQAESENKGELQLKIVKLQESEARVKEALESLQEELGHLDRENSNLKRQLRARRCAVVSVGREMRLSFYPCRSAKSSVQVAFRHIPARSSYSL